jgi:hypothetical protein
VNHRQRGKYGVLIYLDANIVQYCADEFDFIFGETDDPLTNDPRLRRELVAIRKLVDLEQLGNWDFAAPRHLLVELRAGRPTAAQRETYTALEDAWDEERWTGNEPPTEVAILAIERSLGALRLKHASDRRHLAEALALGASWFLTNDGEVIRKTKGNVKAMRVCRPTESLKDISVGLFLK